jgi:hypothetical protein
MGYARGVRRGHAGGHLRQPVEDIVETLYKKDRRWWDVDAGNGDPFDSAAAVYKHLGRLWHCTDTVPNTIRSLAEDILGEGNYFTYAQLVRALRPYVLRQSADVDEVRRG